MLRIAICDDEEYYRNKIHTLLDSWVAGRGMEYAVSLFSSGADFLSEKENAVGYDVVFMDINMEEMDGIDTAKRIRQFHSDTCIVFVTAFISYALEGYKVNAVRYLMKDTLEAALPECMDAILKKMQVRQVTFPFVEGERTLYTDNILYVESRKHKSFFSYLDNEIVNYQIYDKLDHIEQQLAAYGFLRIHKSFLVNMKHIRKISNYAVLMDWGETLPVPRLRFQAVREAFVAYKGAM